MKTSLLNCNCQTINIQKDNVEIGNGRAIVMVEKYSRYRNRNGRAIVMEDQYSGREQ